jgi:MFS superfamily sulfate permease-like transporter
VGHYRFFGVVIIGTLEGILTAVIISLLDIIVHGSHPPVYEMGRKPGADVFRPLSDHAHYETVPGLLIIRVEGRLFFANASRIRERVWARIQ